MCALFCTFLSGYDGAKITEVDQHLAEYLESNTERFFVWTTLVDKTRNVVLRPSCVRLYSL